MFWQTKHAKSREWNERNTRISPQRVSGPLKLKQNLAFLFARRRGTLYCLRWSRLHKESRWYQRLSFAYSLLRGILELLFVVPICGQHTQVATVAPLSVLLSSVEELSSLLWVLLHHTSEANLTLQVVLELIPLWLFAIE